MVAMTSSAGDRKPRATPPATTREKRQAPTQPARPATVKQSGPRRRTASEPEGGVVEVGPKKKDPRSE
jgi:hypothetical protein